MITIEIADNQNSLSVDVAWLRSLARHVLRHERIDAADLSVALVDDSTIHDVNLRFLGHDYPTDVVTFPLSEPGERLAGEIVIGAERAVEESLEHGWSGRLEASLYLVHGLLHLCGHDDADDESAGRMARRQRELLDAFVAEERARGRDVTTKEANRAGGQ